MWRFFRKHIEAYGIGAVFGLMLFLLINVAMGRDILPAPRRAFTRIETPVVETDPQQLYVANCQACHQAEGQGMAGAFPPLAGSSWVTEDPETPIRILLRGLQGPIEVNGETFNGVMPAQGHLSDEQIANVLTHVRSSFGNEAGPVEPALVATIRAELSSQTAAWTAEELQAARAQ